MCPTVCAQICRAVYRLLRAKRIGGVLAPLPCFDTAYSLMALRMGLKYDESAGMPFSRFPVPGCELI